MGHGSGGAWSVGWRRMSGAATEAAGSRARSWDRHRRVGHRAPGTGSARAAARQSARCTSQLALCTHLGPSVVPPEC
eukprot:6995935-Prymnesium_polylepis.3